jgi:hypothetical protein
MVVIHHRAFLAMYAGEQTKIAICSTIRHDRRDNWADRNCNS